jgi:hypothetical protein
VSSIPHVPRPSVPIGLLAVLLSSPPLAAQEAGAPPAGAASPQSIEELQRQLAAERAAREDLERRLAALEKRMTPSDADEMERQLAVLVEPGGLDQAATRPPSSPAFYNPAIGVFMDGVADFGNYDRRLGEDSDKFSLRETEIDMRLPVSPFATGVGVFSWENLGDNEFESTVEEGYADIGLGKLFDRDWDTTARLGRFRPLFGRNNQLHLHDWMQVNQPIAVQNLLGDEGVIGEGVMFNTPLFHSGEQAGEGRTTTLNLALVNGELFTGEDNAPGSIAEDAGDPLSSDGAMAVTRLSQFVELGPLSDVEVGVSNISRLDDDAVELDTGEQVDASYWDADVTWRSRDDETGVGSWLVQAEAIRADVDDEGAGVFADGHRDGWWTTVQRQISPTVYLGLLYSESELLDSATEQSAISPYLSWYADEFFRIRTQLDFLQQDDSADDFSDAHRLLMQFTWNFGAHAPHPYWVNR